MAVVAGARRRPALTPSPPAMSLLACSTATGKDLDSIASEDDLAQELASRRGPGAEAPHGVAEGPRQGVHVHGRDRAGGRGSDRHGRAPRGEHAVAAGGPGPGRAVRRRRPVLMTPIVLACPSALEEEEGTAALLRVGARMPPCSGKVPLSAHGVRDASSLRIRSARGRGGGRTAIGRSRPAPSPARRCSTSTAPSNSARPGIDVSDCPTVATARGWHVYFRGLDRGTIKLPFGELRSHGSYVICPPSYARTGRIYTWLLSAAGAAPRPFRRRCSSRVDGGNGRGSASAAADADSRRRGPSQLPC